MWNCTARHSQACDSLTDSAGMLNPSQPEKAQTLNKIFDSHTIILPNIDTWDEQIIQVQTKILECDTNRRKLDVNCSYYQNGHHPM